MVKLTASLAAILLGLPLGAQGLDLEVRGGSMPGTLSMQLSPGTPGLQGALILLSITTGPTPLSLLNPSDPRVLRVGLELASVAQSGPFQGNGRFSPPVLPVPNLPVLIDRPLFFQGLSIPGSPFIVDKISLPRAVRFAPAGQFRDRFTSFRHPRSFFPVLEVADGELLLVGGGQGNLLAQVAQKTTEYFDPITDTFRDGPDMTTERSLHTATFLPAQNLWLLVAGVDRLNDPQNSVEVFDPSVGQFAARSPMRDKRMGHTATLLSNGKVLVAGGMSDLTTYAVLNTTTIYDPVANTWTPGPNMNAARLGHAALPLPDGRVLLAGGGRFNVFIGIPIPVIHVSCDVYDPATNMITPGPVMSTQRAISSVIEIAPGRFLLAGGVSTSVGAPTATAEIFDFATFSWSGAGSMSTPRGMLSVFPLGNGLFLHVGGADGSVLAPTPLASTEIYDAGTNRWSPGPPMPAARAAYGSYVNATGQLHILGGSLGGSGVVNSTLWFYP